ncbi:protein takeout-like [Anoplophora glabripennis]|uniref:protein takeout-like n=1 Tax=Anoplophora glabripennis TaxID=217634 RepID=UPI000875885F|nr:protein takeout-like [Anoplophora glabripennis]
MPCSRSNNFNECAIKSGQYAIPFLLNGDRQLKIPSLNPVKIEFVELTTSNLNLKLRNVEVYGLDKLKILNVTVDFDKRKVRTITAIDRSTILAQYEMKGRIILPLTGHGPANITLYNGVYQYEAEWEFTTRNRNRYLKIIDSKYDYTSDKITYDFKNLFNGDKVWSTEMNRILNENWMQVNEDLKTPFLETLLAFQNDISTKIFSQIPYDELFLD